MSETRPADYVTLMWDNQDGTYTVELTDFTVTPPLKEVRLLHDEGEMVAGAKHFNAGSTVIPTEVDHA